MSLLDKKTAVSVLAKTHENASTQIDVPGSVAAKITQIGQRLIPDEALAGEGRVGTPHVTVKYGVKEDAETLRAISAKFGPFIITLDKVEVFTPSESGNGSAPVVVEVHGAELVRMHRAVMQAMGTVGDDFPYVPHITLAYVKPEEAQHFAGNDSFAGISFTATAVTLSFHDDDVKEKVPLGKAAASPSMQPEIPQRPPMDEPEDEKPKFEYRKQTYGDSWIVYDANGDAVHFADSEEDAKDAIVAFESGQTPGQVQRTKPAVQPQPLPQTPKGWRAPKKPTTQLTNFKKWFGASKVVDDDGEPLKVYHGTTHEVDAFDIDKANPENYYGKAFYFSSSPTDVESNNATPTGGDITSRLGQRAEQIESELGDDFFAENGYYAQGDELDVIVELASDQAHQELLGPNQGTTMPVYLSVKKPVIVEKKGGTYFEINFDERTEEESGNGVDLYNAVLLCASNYGGRGAEVWQEVSENAGPEFNAWKFEEVVRGLDILEDDNGSINSGGFIAEVYQELGYDGIIMNAWEEFGGGSKYKQMEMDYDTKHYVVFSANQIKSAIGNVGKFDKKNPSITGAVKPESKKFLETMGEKVVEEKTIGDYDFFVTYNSMMGVYQIGMQRAGMDAADMEQQMEHQQQNRGAGSRQELKSTIQGWLNQYHMLIIGSMNPEKTMKYVRLLKAMGFNPQKQMVMGLPLAFITDGTIKTSSIKIAGRKDATTSMVVTVDPESVPWFPKQILL